MKPIHETPHSSAGCASPPAAAPVTWGPFTPAIRSVIVPQEFRPPIPGNHLVGIRQAEDSHQETNQTTHWTSRKHAPHEESRRGDHPGHQGGRTAVTKTQTKQTKQTMKTIKNKTHPKNLAVAITVALCSLSLHAADTGEAGWEFLQGQWEGKSKTADGNEKIERRSFRLLDEGCMIEGFTTRVGGEVVNRGHAVYYYEQNGDWQISSWGTEFGGYRVTGHAQAEGDTLITHLVGTSRSGGVGSFAFKRVKVDNDHYNVTTISVVLGETSYPMDTDKVVEFHRTKGPRQGGK